MLSVLTSILTFKNFGIDYKLFTLLPMLLLPLGPLTLVLYYKQVHLWKEMTKNKQTNHCCCGSGDSEEFEEESNSKDYIEVEYVVKTLETEFYNLKCTYLNT